MSREKLNDQNPAPASVQTLPYGEDVPSAFTIRDNMEVVASCGTRVGTIDNVEGKQLKLKQSGGKHHFIPMAWVDHVDEQVHLNRNAEDVMREWQAEPAPTTD